MSESTTGTATTGNPNPFDFLSTFDQLGQSVSAMQGSLTALTSRIAALEAASTSSSGSTTSAAPEPSAPLSVGMDDLADDVRLLLAQWQAVWGELFANNATFSAVTAPPVQQPTQPADTTGSQPQGTSASGTVATTGTVQTPVNAGTTAPVQPVGVQVPAAPVLPNPSVQ